MSATATAIATTHVDSSIARLLGWDTQSYSLDASYFSQDDLTAKVFLFWFVSISSNSFAILFGLYNFAFGAHPKFYFTRKMFVSLHFHILVGALEFMLMLAMYLSAPCLLFSRCLVALDCIQNATIWIQMSGSSGSKFVVNGVFVYLMCAKAATDAYLLLVNPLSKDALFALYFFLSGFTFTRYTGMTMKWLNLFASMRYTLSVYSGSMICASLALGECGPVSLYAFICCYTVYRKHCCAAGNCRNWEKEAKRNPFPIAKVMKLDKMAKEAPDEDKCRLVFDTIAGKKGATHLPVANLSFLLATSGVAESEVKQAMKECAVDYNGKNGLTFEMFYARYPSVWKWYFGYMHSQNEM